MRAVSLLARPMLAGVFVVAGAEAARAPGGRAEKAAGIGVPLPDVAVRLNGAAMVLGGAALAIGYKPRRSALALAGSLGVTTYAGHRFWEVQDPAEQGPQRVQFLKNLGLMSGLLYVMTEPRSGKEREKVAAKVERAEKKAAKKAGKKAAKAATRKARRESKD